MNITIRLLTSLLKNKIEIKVNMAKEQQGFQKIKSQQTQATFIIRQLKEKSIQYNKWAYLRFVDLKSVFRRVRRLDILEILQDLDIHPNIIELMKDIIENHTKVRRNNRTLSDKMWNKTEILNHSLFNLIMERIVLEVEMKEGNRMEIMKITILCYADDRR